MNEFLEQFLIESRELVDQASGDFLALEAAPGDRARIESAFRAVHTLKGAAGIMDFHAMGRALHALEDVLSRLQSGANLVTPALVAGGLEAMDRVTGWLDAMQADGVPPAAADAEADTLVARFSGAATDPPPEASVAEEDWAAELLARYPEAARDAACALRYAPDPDCFFRGEDPLARVSRLPGLLALEIAPAAPWPALAELDPFACNLTLLALLSGPPDAVAGLVTGAEVRPLRPGARSADAASALSEPALALLDAQLDLLAGHPGEGAAGRIASAGRVAGNVLRHAGRAGDAEAVGRAAAESLAAGEGSALARAIARARDGGDETPAEMAAPARPAADTSPEPAGPSGEAAARYLRVDMERVDALLTLAGELTVAKNAFAHVVAMVREGGDPVAVAAALSDQQAGLDRLVGRLQQTVLGLRLLPLSQVFGRFPRLLREIAGSLGKPARLVLEGEATEADKAVVDALFEPLLHGIRNALDHGIEPPAERERLGKPPVATIRLRAAREGEQLRVEVEDDGRGVDVAAIRAAAARRGLLSAEALAALPDEGAIDLVFAPGFSTASAVTDLSGRGVGMDAVRRAVERMGGRVAIESRPGVGTTLRMLLPFSVMLTRVMTVEVDGQAFGIPLDAVVETVRVPRSRIVPVGGARAFVLRGRTVPLLALGEALGRSAGGTQAPDVSVVVVAAGDQLGGFEVERLGGQMEVMLKPVEGLLSDAAAIAGTTLLGDGRVLIVLDPQELLA
ncbi:chemotaxis protein CheA [Salinarimonas soli]|uniref:chemotaxis protein CheA n=1 Tax=Salinarimonas soli TaxID=1638099 RepID=UPI001F0B6509|nr:chemotaxis protein CheA [Salinarimonas soli]